MDRYRRKLLVLLLALVVLPGGLTLAAHLPGSDDVTPLKASAPLFRITGKIRGVYPGRTAVLRVKLRNPHPFAIRVMRVSATPSSSVLGCPAKALKVRPWHGRRIVGPHGIRRVRLRIKMRRSAPNACQGVRFSLSYTGKARKA